MHAEPALGRSAAHSPATLRHAASFPRGAAPPARAPRPRRGASPSRPIRVLLHHHDLGVRTALTGLIAAEPDMVVIASASRGGEVFMRARRTRADIAVVDCSHAADDGLSLAHKLKALPQAPRVLVDLPGGDPAMTVAAIVAGVDGLVSMSDRSGAITEAIRWVAGGTQLMPQVPLSAVSRVASRLDRDQRPTLAMLVSGKPATEIAAALSISDCMLEAHRWAMLERLRQLLAQIALAEGPAGPERFRDPNSIAVEAGPA